MSIPWSRLVLALGLVAGLALAARAPATARASASRSSASTRTAVSCDPRCPVSGTCAASTCSGSTLLTGLVAFWSFDGSAVDATGGYDGAPSAGLTYGTGKIGGSAVFDASGDNVVVSPVAPLGTVFTVSAWVKTYNQVSYRFILGAASPLDTRISLAMDAAGRPAWWQGTYKVAAGSYPCANLTWCHVVITGDGANVRFWVNNSYDGVHAVATSANVGWLGNADPGTTGYLDGELDAVGVWNRVLTAAEMTSLENGGAGAQYPFTGL